MQWLLGQTVKLAQYGQGIGAAARSDKAVLRKLKRSQTPSSAAFRELAQRFGGRGNVLLNNVALGAEQGEETLYFDVPGSELSSLYPRRIEHHGHRMNESERVLVDTVDHYCATRAVDHIDLLKLDVEGHELAVLRGASRMFEGKKIAMVSFEFGGCDIDSRSYLRDFFEFFFGYGMRLSRVTGFGTLHPIARYGEALEQFRTTTFVAS
jgi:FkbM family methyltransferase